MGLFEREQLLSALEAELAGALGGAGRIVLVTGEAGIGKTALVNEFTRAARSPVKVLTGYCDPVAAPRPLAPLGDVAPLLTSRFRSMMVDNADAFAVTAAFVEELSLEPTILLLEDLHWADGSTLDLLVHLARRIDRAAVLCIATFRSDEVGPDHPLRLALGRLGNIRPRTIAVPPLTLDAVTELCGSSGIDPQRLWEATSGNAFFVTEVLASGEIAVTDSVVDSVLARASGLGSAARSLLDAVAIMPRGMVLSLVDEFADDAEAVDECVERGLLIMSKDRAGFRHELARLAIDTALPPARGRQLHRRVLALLESNPGADVADLAHHAERAGDGAAVQKYALVAAQRASRAGATRAAATHFTAVVDHAGPGATGVRAEALEGLGMALAALGDAKGGIANLDHAAALRDADGDTVSAQRDRIVITNLLWTLGRGREARAQIDAIVASLDNDDGDDPANLALALAQQAFLQMLARENEGAIVAGRRAVELALRSGDHSTLSKAWNAIGSALWFLRPDEAQAALEGAVEHARLAGDPRLAASALINLGSGAGEIRRYSTADRWLDESMHWCRTHDLDAALAYATAWRARTALEQGDWPLAERLAYRALAEPTTLIARTVALTVTGLLRCRRGDPRAEQPLIEAWGHAERSGDLQRLWPVAAALAEHRFWAEEHVDDPARLVAVLAEAGRRTHDWASGELRTWLRRADDVHVPDAGAAPSAPYAAWLDGRFADAAAQWRELGCPFDEALVLIDEDSRSSLLAALEIIDRLGARAVGARVRQRLRALGVVSVPRGSRGTTRAHPFGLTPREAEVLELVKAGHSNAEIAKRLVLSVRTVDHHVSAILRKAGVASRRAAAALPG